jgi:hypothetical protein
LWDFRPDWDQYRYFVKYLSENEQLNEGQLKNYINLISELVNEIIPPTETPEQRKQKFRIYIDLWNPVLQK